MRGRHAPPAQGAGPGTLHDDSGLTPQPPAAPAVVIEALEPEIDNARFPIKRVVGETVEVSADVFAEGHEQLAAVVQWRHVPAPEWSEVLLRLEGNDRWEAEFRVAEIGRYEYTVEAWVDHFASWREALEKKFTAGQDVGSELLEGAALVRDAALRAAPADGRWFAAEASALSASTDDQAVRVERALSPALAAAMMRHPDRRRASRYPRVLAVDVERERARFGAWYEMFPRSCAPEPGRHGTFKDCAARLPYVAAMGFDVVYLPPIHPVGTTHRKGKNNAATAAADDVGSPWGIGGPDGGHMAVHPALGTLDDFDHVVATARDHGIEIALDIAFQCSPDHPYVMQHPTWFRWRPDKSIQYAENPPKRYQDIYPLNFESEHWRELWEELKRVVLFWVGHGVTIFRVDNPHTKPFAFWEWLIREVRRAHPEVFFLAEAFTRPKVMRYLAKLGFSQSYSYFTWRNTKDQLTEYFTELTHTAVREYMRPNLFVNTPDILHEFLQTGGRPAFQIRLVLAATLAANYGIYGPPFELMVTAAHPGSEEYVDSEKYQLRHWDLDRPDSLRDFIARVNQIRRETPALRHDRSLRFCEINNEHLLFYAKSTPDLSDIVFVVVNLDPHHTQTGWVQIPLADYALDSEHPYQVHDVLGDAHYLWHGARNYVSLDPQVVPAHILRVRRRIKTERDFDYFA